MRCRINASFENTPKIEVINSYLRDVFVRVKSPLDMCLSCVSCVSWHVCEVVLAFGKVSYVYSVFGSGI